MAQANPYDQFDRPTQSQGAVFRDPYADDEQARAEEDQAIQREQLRIAQRNAAIAEERAARDAAEFQQQQSEAAELDQVQAQSDTKRLAQIEAILDTIDRLESRTRDGSGIGSIEGQEDFRSGDRYLGASQFFNQDANSVYGLLEQVQGDMTQQVLAQLVKDNGGTGASGMANTAAEAARMAAAIAPLNQTMEPEEFAAGLKKAREYYQRLQQNLTGESEPPELPNRDGEMVPASQIQLPQADPMEAAGAGATETSIPVPEEMQQEYLNYIAKNWGNHDARDLEEFVGALELKYDRPVGVPDYGAFVDRINGAAAEGAGPDVVGPIPATNRELSSLEQVRNNVISNPLGTGFASFSNAATLGAVDALSGNKLDMARELNPVSGFVGDMAGATVGTMATGGALGALGGAGRVATLAKNPLAADAVYGGFYGFNESDGDVADALFNAGLGATFGVAGGKMGDVVGNSLPALTGVRMPDEPFRPSERAVVDTFQQNPDEVAQALAQADSLGVPMTLADASPEFNALGGSAVRYSPTTAGTAREVLAQRNQGQLDRLVDAVERDLGPVQNVPQRSEELVQQARANAGPLYDAAYAAPGAENLDITDLADRPTFEAALREAYNEMLDEGVDPSAAGILVDESGAMIASPSWQALDYVKRGLDNVIEANTSKLDGVNAAGRRAVQMKNELLSRMDAANPDYAAARAAYAGPAGERAALMQGEKATRARPDQLGVDIANMTPEQLAQMRLGFQSETVGQAGNLRNNSNPWAQLNTPHSEGRLGTLYSGDDFDIANLLSQRDLELRLAGNSNRLIGNSMTAEREVADEFFKNSTGADGMNVPLAVAETAMTGGPFISVGKGIADRMFRGRKEAAAAEANRSLADELGPMLFEGNPADVDAMISDLLVRDSDYLTEYLEKQAQARLRGNYLGSGAAQTINQQTIY